MNLFEWQDEALWDMSGTSKDCAWSDAERIVFDLAIMDSVMETHVTWIKESLGLRATVTLQLPDDPRIVCLLKPQHRCNRCALLDYDEVNDCGVCSYGHDIDRQVCNDFTEEGWEDA